jgi:hypothetical protein
MIIFLGCFFGEKLKMSLDLDLYSSKDYISRFGDKHKSRTGVSSDKNQVPVNEHEQESPPSKEAKQSLLDLD